MATIRQCAMCGAVLTESAPDGQCPECLIQLGLKAGVACAADPSDGGFGLLPREFGDYTLIEEIARGGMGVVYRARQKSLGRIVAVKLILSGHFAGKDSIHRFRSEASSAAALQHPNIVAIHEVGLHQGEHYLAMDWVDGPNLAQFVKSQPLPAHRAARYLKTMAEAIQYAHERGILHRDLKPSNILIDPNDQPRVTDFGLAKRLVAADVRSLNSSVEPVSEKVSEPVSGSLTVEETPSHSPAYRPNDSPARNNPSLLTSAATEITLTGQVLGSPNYIPPEQASGKRGQVSRQSDVYSLGAILYHLLTGRGPFVSDTVADVLQQVLHEEPVSPRLLNRSVPRDLETICLKCLEKEPARRYTTAQELADELDHFLKNEPIRARPASRAEKIWRWCRRKPTLASSLTAAAVLLLFVAVGAPVAVFRINRERQRVQYNLVRQYVANGTRLVNDGDLFGSLLWYVKALELDAGDPEREAPHRIRIASVLSQCPKLVHLFKHGTVLFGAEFSPDGQYVITCANDNTARVWDLETGDERLVLRHEGPVHEAIFSRDSHWIATSSYDHTARIWDAATGAPVSPPLRHDGVVWHSAFSFDGQRVATCSSDRTVRIWSSRTGEPLGIPLKAENSVQIATFSPDGSRLVGEDTTGSTVIWDLRSGQKVWQNDNGGAPGESNFSPDGRRFINCLRGGIRIRDAATLQELPYSPIVLAGTVQSACFSPDGKYIVAADESPSTQVWDAITGQPVFPQSIQTSSRVRNVNFSPDNRLIVTAGEGPAAQVWDGKTGRPASPPLRSALPVSYAAFHPDGRRLLIFGDDQTVRIWDLAISGPSNPIHAQFESQHHLLSPDGRQRLANGSNNQVFVINMLDDAVLLPLNHSHHITYESFSDDGRIIITACPDGQFLGGGNGYVVDRNNVFIWDAATGRCLSGTNMFGTSLPRYAAFSSDGRKVLTCGLDSSARVWDATSGRPMTPILRHLNTVNWGAFHPDGERLVTASLDGTVRMWNAASGEPLGAPMHHAQKILRTSWSRNGKWLRTIMAGNQSRTWDLATGEPLTTPRDLIWYHAATNVSDTNSAPGDEDSLALDCRPVTDLVRLSETLAATMIDEKGNQVLLSPEAVARNYSSIKAASREQFAVTKTEIRAWHHRQAEKCLNDERVGSARFHVEQELSIISGDKELAKLQRLTAIPDESAAREDLAAWLFRKSFPARNPGLSANLIDLSDRYNFSLIQPNGIDLSQLPTGHQLMGGTPFDIRGAIELMGTSMLPQRETLPKRVDGIRVGLKCQRLHFLHATEYEANHGTQVGSYILHYADGQIRELPIVSGRDIACWSSAAFPFPGPSKAKIVWTGCNRLILEDGQSVALFKSTRGNPRPNVEIGSVDFVSSMAFPSPFLVALTVE